MNRWRKDWKDMKTTKLLTTTLAILVLSACGKQPGIEPYDEHPTKRTVAMYLAGDMLGYDLYDEEWECSTPFEDIDDNTPLCRAIEVLQRRAMGYGYAPWYDHNFNDKFFPDTYVGWHMMLQYVGPQLGYQDAEHPCIDTFSDITGGDGYSSTWMWFGGLCAKRIIREGDQINADEYVTWEEWDLLKSRIKEFLDAPSTRIFAAEHLGKVFVPEKIEILTPYWCSGPHADIPEDTINCHITQGMWELGYIVGDPDGNFRPERSINEAELAKVSVEINDDNFSPEETGCYRIPPGSWFAEYMDILCEDGYLDTTNAPDDAGEEATNRDIVWLASDIKIHHPRYE
ncbi:S-layer homology domain-containing protein [Patescibacteria group bacterium]